MKKTSALILVILMLLLPILPASASDVNIVEQIKVWSLGKDAEYITDGRYTYFPIDFERRITIFNLDSYELKTNEDEYKGSRVYTDRNNVIVRAEISTENSWYDRYYVEESHLDEFNKLKDGVSETYVASNDYSMLESITKTEYILARGGDEYHMSARKLEEFESFLLYAADSTGNYRYECGQILRSYSDNSEMFILTYDEYDRSYFYRGGEFATDHDGEVTIYKIKDAELIGRLNKNFDTLPEDELDWVVNNKADNTFVAVFATIFFAVTPLGVALVALILMLKIKDKKYRLPFILILLGSAAVIIAYAVIFSLIATN